MGRSSSLKTIYKRFETPIKYALFGIGTSVINFGIFFLGTELVRDPNKEFFALQWWEIVNIAAWLAANIYSFYVNRRFVFKTRSKDKISLLREIFVFFGIRLFSFFISAYIMSAFINIKDLDHQIAKLLGVTVEVAINYFTCKLFVFRKPKK
ncbi:MAG: GtrA family protein [Ruminococcaceae bacterium]|nr:GtrA family protein [Oscillospiraceae bacterium]